MEATINDFCEGEKMKGEDGSSAPSTPLTPCTSGAPLLGSLKPEIISTTTHIKPSLLKSCKLCFGMSLEERGLHHAPPPPPVSLARKVGAEFIGTLILIFSATATVIVNQKTNGSETLMGTASSTGLAVMIVILSIGHISGAHLNPSVTIAFAALKRFPWKHVPVYIGAQVIASMVAAFILKVVFHPTMGGGVTVPEVGYAQAFALEFIITFNHMFVVTAVSTDTRALGKLAGIAVGAIVMLNNLIAGPTTGASMNPVRTLGSAIAANNYKGIWIYLTAPVLGALAYKGIWIYLTAPVLGALAGAGVYSVLKLPDLDDKGYEKALQEHSLER